MQRVPGGLGRDRDRALSGMGWGGPVSGQRRVGVKRAGWMRRSTVDGGWGGLSKLSSRLTKRRACVFTRRGDDQVCGFVDFQMGIPDVPVRGRTDRQSEWEVERFVVTGLGDWSAQCSGVVEGSRSETAGEARTTARRLLPLPHFHAKRPQRCQVVSSSRHPRNSAFLPLAALTSRRSFSLSTG